HTRFSRDWSSDVCSSDLGHCNRYVGATRKPARAARHSGRESERHVQPAVDGDVGAGDVIALRVGEKGDGVGDILGISHAAHRDAGDDLVANVLGDGGGHAGGDVSGRHRVHGQALECRFLGQRHGEAVHAGLGRGVIGLTELALLAVHRGDVDDAPETALDHALDDLARDVEDAAEIDVDHVLPVLLVHLAKGLVAGDAGAFHEDVDPAEVRFYLGDHALRIAERGHVAGDDVDVVLLLFQLLLPVPGLVGLARKVTGDDPVAALGECLADRGAQTPGAAGYQCGFVAHVIATR